MGTSKLSGKPDKMLGVTCNGLASHPGGVVIFLVSSCYRNQDKLQQLCEPGLCLVLLTFFFCYNNYNNNKKKQLYLYLTLNSFLY